MRQREDEDEDEGDERARRGDSRAFSAPERHSHE